MLKKCKKFDDVLIINLAEHFEKGKRQKFLKPEHIEHFFARYQDRRADGR